MKKEIRIIVSSIVMFVLVNRLSGVEAKQEGLSYKFYEKSCPNVEEIVKVGLAPIFLTDPSSPAAFLRLMFHDCQVQGCDASILVDLGGENATFDEMGSTKNFGIRKRESISVIKAMVEALCPQQVSCADLVIMAAREAVAVAGGPRITIPMGRRDSMAIPSYKDADKSLPSSSIGVSEMLHLFAQKGMTVDESVAIMGAHTLGITHCLNIQERLYKSNESDKKELEPKFEAFLKLNCPEKGFIENLSFVMNDPSNVAFDNAYYINAIQGRGILRVDAEMVSDSQTAPIVETFSIDKNYFFREFASGFVKLSSFGVLTGNEGVIRQRCNVID